MPRFYLKAQESFYTRKELNSHRIVLVHQHGSRYIVLEHQCDCRDFMSKHSKARLIQ